MSDSIVTSPKLPLSPEAYGLVALLRGPQSVTVGDTFSVQLHVTWKTALHPWLLVGQNSPETKGITLVGQQSGQATVDGQEEQIITYQLVSSDTGSLQIPALQFQLPTLQGQSIRLTSNSLPIRVNSPCAWEIWLGLVVVFGIALFLWVRQRRRKTHRLKMDVQHQQFMAAFDLEFKSLAERVANANPQKWMASLADLLAEYPLHPSTEDSKADLAKLHAALQQARYGGGPRDSWENREWLRIAQKLYQEHWNTHTLGKDTHG